MGCLFRVRSCALILTLAAPMLGQAAEPNPDAGEWARWVQQQVSQLPASRAIDARQQAWLADTRNQRQPLYNPALNIGYQDSVETTKTLGLSQQLDWSGKARARRDLGGIRERLARLRADKARADLLARSLKALIADHAARARLRAARSQERQLQTLADLVQQRQQAGDVGQVDARLTLLSVGQAQQALAEEEAAATQAAIRLREVMALSKPAYSMPGNLAGASHPLGGNEEARLAANYDLQLAQEQVALAEQSVRVADKGRNADPTLGVRVGEEGGEDLWGLDLTLPLKFFNTGKPGYQQALANSDAKQALLDKTRNDIRARLDGARTAFRQQQQRWQTFQQLTETRLKESDALLKRVWQQGELSTQNYLLALNQSLETRLSGIALRKAMREAWVDWLYESAQLNDWLGQLAD